MFTVTIERPFSYPYDEHLKKWPILRNWHKQKLTLWIDLRWILVQTSSSIKDSHIN